ERSCGADPELRRRVEALLHAHDEPASFLERPAPAMAGASCREFGADRDASDPVLPAVETIPAKAQVEGAGSRLGHYVLLEQIGEGGMGAVFMAEQTQPVRRRVALKIIKPGMDSRQVLARFGAERQALALMDHPNIAKVLDAGATDDGRPYFAME